MTAREFLIVDLFCGAGGMSKGIRDALGRDVDHALNHDAHAIEQHRLNHPRTTHHQGDVWAIPSWMMLPGKRRPHIRLLAAAPDCTHFSIARGAAPREQGIRDLPWSVVQWAQDIRPDTILVENVREILSWGPLYPPDHPSPHLRGKPIPEQHGDTWRAFVERLRMLGYLVEWRVLRACDFGDPTSRERLILFARCDGRPVCWPEPTHGAPDSPEVLSGERLPWRTAAECIDWSLPMASIFLTQEEARTWAQEHKTPGVPRRPLAEKTQARIAAGIQKYVLGTADPFIVRIGHHGSESGKVHPLHRPLSTITTKAEHLLIAPSLIQMGYGERDGQPPRCLDLHAPLSTITAQGKKHALVVAFLNKHYGGVVGQDLRRPLGTITSKDHHSLGVAFLTKFYGTAVGQDAREPIPTITTKDRFGLVVAWLRAHGIDQPPIVRVDGESYAIADISLRMLSSDELALAQGLATPERPYLLTGSEKDKVARIGNSVPPRLIREVVRANLCDDTAQSRGAA